MRNVSEYSEADLLASTNPFALVMLTAKLALKSRRLPDEESDELLLSVIMKHLKILFILTCFSFTMAWSQESKSQQSEYISHNRMVEQVKENEKSIVRLNEGAGVSIPQRLKQQIGSMLRLK